MYSSLWASVLTIAAIFVAVVSQRIPSRSTDPSQLQLSDAELYIGSKMLPDGVEIVSYLRKYITSRYYFMVEDEDQPLEIVVTPCGSTIIVNIFVQSLPPEGSGVGSDYEDDLFRQYNRLSHRPADLSQPIKTFKGNDVMKYRAEVATVGIYVIEVTADDIDCPVRMSASTSPFSDLIYPELPRNAGVTSRFVSKATVELSWKRSPSAWRHGQPIEYCVAVNRLRHFTTHCAARSAKYGDLLPTAPPDAGYRFAWQNVADKRGSRRPSPEEGTYKKRRKPEVPIKTGNVGEVVYQCIGNRTRFVFDEVFGHGDTYYFDVFAVNKNSNSSSTYVGTKVVAKGDGKTVKLKDGKLVSVHLKRSVVERTFVYHLDRNTSEMAIQIHPCSGQFNVTVFTEHGARILDPLWNITHLETIRIKDATPGSYYIRVVKTGRPQSTSFRISASSDPALVSYPDLPKDIQPKTFEKLNTCNSVTVAWMGTGTRQKYCLYARPVKSKSSHDQPGPIYDRCLGHNDRPKSEKLVCRYFRAVNERKSVMTETVRRLKPRTSYIFTVYAVKQGKKSLPYETFTVKTKDVC